ncbi:uncharacterized protein [Periplaneta americana]|uniref:uncharacterized protein isoform X3 n=1 Tax=Periplaneta americana TaxID=6978 RepID=UPI0037E8FA12
MNVNKVKPEEDPLAMDENNDKDVKRCEFLSEPCLEMYVKKEAEDDSLAEDRIADTYEEKSLSKISLKSVDSFSHNIKTEVKDEKSPVPAAVCEMKCESEIKVEFEDSSFNLITDAEYEENPVPTICRVPEAESEGRA